MLLPSTCSSNPEGELQALGLPQQTVEAILSSVNKASSDRFISTSFSYSETGETRYTFLDTGTIHRVRDTDGRELEITDLLGNKTEHSYTVHGFPENTVMTDAQGNRLRETYRQLDEEGRLTYECAVQTAGGCRPVGSLNPPNGVVNRYEYWPEGSLRTTIDPEGLMTEFNYNERKLLIKRHTKHSVLPSAARGEAYAYNVDGDVLGVYYSAFPPGPWPRRTILSETYAYDGLRRLKTYTNTRQYAWQLAYSNRDLLTRYKRDDLPYGQASPTSPVWETVLNYDDFGRLLRRIDNGILTARYTRTNDGAIFKVSSTGFGDSFTTFDLLGRPVWTRDPAGNQIAYTWRAVYHRSPP